MKITKKILETERYKSYSEFNDESYRLSISFITDCSILVVLPTLNISIQRRRIEFGWLFFNVVAFINKKN